METNENPIQLNKCTLKWPLQISPSYFPYPCILERGNCTASTILNITWKNFLPQFPPNCIQGIQVYLEYLESLDTCSAHAGFESVPWNQICVRAKVVYVPSILCIIHSIFRNHVNTFTELLLVIQHHNKTRLNIGK